MTRNKGSQMTQKKKPYLKILTPPDDLREVKRKMRRLRREKARRILSTLVMIFLAACGTYLLLKTQTYGLARIASQYPSDVSDTSSYAQFANGIVRYNRDGVVFLNRENEEQWIQPAQIQNPVIKVKGDSFAVADNGGNSIMVFTEEGLKGEIETTLPIEKIAVSEQGIVSAILNNESSPKIISYDSTGNVLVEQQVSLSTTGYPVAMEMSGDGNMLAVSYLYTEGARIRSRVIFYNFGEAGQSKTDNIVSQDEYEDTVIADVFFMGNDCSVAVGDNSFVIYNGSDIPEKAEEIRVDQEIQSVFHSDRYIGFILLNREKSGYELRLYNRRGDIVINREIPGMYSHAKIQGDEVIMWEGSMCCIITDTGVTKFEGDISVDVLEFFRAPGLNRYYVMSVGELREIYLTK